MTGLEQPNPSSSIGWFVGYACAIPKIAAETMSAHWDVHDLTVEDRRKIQSGLITISKNGRVHKLCTQVNSDAVYAFSEEE